MELTVALLLMKLAAVNSLALDFLVETLMMLDLRILFLVLKSQILC